MKGSLPKGFALTFLLAFLMAGFSGCVGESDSPAKTAGRQASAIPGKSAGDSFKTPGSRLIEGVLIQETKEDETSISVTWWEIDKNGYVWSQWMSSRKEQGGEAPLIVQVSPVERQRIIADWRAKGHAARVTGLDGNVSELSNVFLRYDPPSGYQWSVPAYLAKTSIDIMVDGKKKTVDFGTISDLAYANGMVTLTLRSGGKLSGPYAPPTFNDKPYRPNLYGIQYGSDGSIRKVEIPFEKVNTVAFAASK